MDRDNPFSKIRASAHATENAAALTFCHSFERIADNSYILSGKLKNEGKIPQRLHTAEIAIDLSDLEVRNSRVLVTDGKMGGTFSRFDLAGAPFAISAEQCFLFQKGETDYILAGLLTWKIFSGVIQLKNQTLTITWQGDDKRLAVGEEIELEKVALMRHLDWQKSLSAYGDALAELNHPRLNSVTWKGWGSWDYYGPNIGERQVLQNLEVLRREHLDCNLIQIDDGYSVYGGDWLDVKTDPFPNGMEAVAKTISSEGFTPGIWLAPFLAHEKSRLATERPEWLLETGLGSLRMEPYPYYVLDYSIDEVCDWLKNVLLTMKHSWGFRYFKLDFLLMGIKPCASARKALTPLERFHRCLGIIKETLGDDTYVLGCTAPFGPSIGYVHGMRTGPDIFPNFEAVKKAAIANLSHSYLHGKVFHCDSDYLVLRSAGNEDEERSTSSGKAGSLSLNEAHLWADFLSIGGNAILAGDKLSKLDKARIDILRQSFAEGCADECVPLDLWAGDASTIPGCILVKKADRILIALFNWSDKPASIRLAGFEKGECLASKDGGEELRAEGGVIAQHLPPRSSQVLTYSGARTFEQLRYDLKPEAAPTPISFPSILGEDFKPEGRPIQIDLGAGAQLPLAVDRRTGRGMQFAGVAEKDRLLGIPMVLGDPVTARVIALRSCDAPKKTRIQVGRRIRSLYILHGCEVPVTGKLNSYVMKFTRHQEIVDLVVGRHIGNTHAHYIMPWTSKIARVAWHNPQNDACLFVMEWHSSRPDLILEEIEVTWPEQTGTLYIVGAVCYE